MKATGKYCVIRKKENGAWWVIFPGAVKK